MSGNAHPVVRLVYGPDERPKQNIIQCLKRNRTGKMTIENATEFLWHNIVHFYFPPTEGYIVWILHNTTNDSTEQNPTFMFRVEHVCDSVLEQAGDGDSNASEPESKWVAFVRVKLPGTGLQGQLEGQIQDLIGANELDPFPNVNRRVGGIIASGGKVRFYSHTMKADATWESQPIALGANAVNEVDVADDFESVHKAMVGFKASAMDA